MSKIDKLIEDFQKAHYEYLRLKYELYEALDYFEEELKQAEYDRENGENSGYNEVDKWLM